MRWVWGLNAALGLLVYLVTLVPTAAAGDFAADRARGIALARQRQSGHEVAAGGCLEVRVPVAMLPSEPSLTTRVPDVGREPNPGGAVVAPRGVIRSLDPRGPPRPAPASP